MKFWNCPWMFRRRKSKSNTVFFVKYGTLTSFSNASHKARAEEKMKKINAAYDVLSDPRKRRDYDAGRGYSQSTSGQRQQREEEERKRWQAQQRQQEAERKRWEEEQRRQQERRQQEEQQRQQETERKRREEQQWRQEAEQKQREVQQQKARPEPSGKPLSPLLIGFVAIVVVVIASYVDNSRDFSSANNPPGVVTRPPQISLTELQRLQKAADQGNAPAQSNLGWMYQNGRGVAQDDRQAVAWYQKAADQGFADAQVNLGWMYENGRGVTQDYAEAYAWYTLAVKNGNDLSSKLKETLRQKMTPAQIVAGEQRANTLQQQIRQKSGAK
jgi:curved DNA-binding protein CbpA